MLTPTNDNRLRRTPLTLVDADEHPVPQHPFLKHGLDIGREELGRLNSGDRGLYIVVPFGDREAELRAVAEIQVRRMARASIC